MPVDYEEREEEQQKWMRRLIRGIEELMMTVVLGEGEKEAVRGAEGQEGNHV